MQLLHKVLEIHPEQTKTNICFDIEVPVDFERLESMYPTAPSGSPIRRLSGN